MTMIERVAKAMNEDVTTGMPGTAWDEDTDVKEHYTHMAGLSIKAMRVPTPHMIAIGDATPTGHSWGIGGEFAACEPLWEAMIDAALEEPADAQVS